MPIRTCSICGVVSCTWPDHVRFTDPLIRRFMKRDDARAAKKRAQSARVVRQNVEWCPGERGPYGK